MRIFEQARVRLAKKASTARRAHPPVMPPWAEEGRPVALWEDARDILRFYRLTATQ